MERIAAVPGPSLEIRDLRVVMALASTGSTARAASLLHITQSAVSRALLSAEEKLGTRLFERTRRGLTPTAPGERLLEGAARLLVELGDLEHRVRAPQAAPLCIRLVCECYTAYHWLPSALIALRQSLPDLRLALEVEHTDDPVAALEAGKIDMALLTTKAVPRGLEERPLFSDEIVFMMGASHPLAGRKAITPRDLRTTPLLTGNTPPEEKQWFLTRVFGRARPQLRFERIPLTEAIVDVARAGLGIAVLSEWIASPHLVKGDLVTKRLASGPLLRPWRLAWRRGFDAAAQRVFSALTVTAPQARLAG
ncbi:LysR family transcriptional regulator [Pendulispora albinea]|uniref:LysR family transcriptional regulator n=1 Tax=Pendulispora albinea TaxID=2741071 RepID=A0ABZ2M821_9BACT